MIKIHQLEKHKHTLLAHTNAVDNKTSMTPVQWRPVPSSTNLASTQLHKSASTNMSCAIMWVAFIHGVCLFMVVCVCCFWWWGGGEGGGVCRYEKFVLGGGRVGLGWWCVWVW